jgi:hypothetical protein
MKVKLELEIDTENENDLTTIEDLIVMLRQLAQQTEEYDDV